MKFRLGVNYWPARKAMAWWSRFELDEVARDFALLSSVGFDSARIFLLWEDFQPAPDSVDDNALKHLLAVADTAERNSLSLIVTLFTGHMSGANWLPEWSLSASEQRQRFPIIAGGKPIEGRAPRNWYSDREIIDAQALLAHSVAETIGAHKALWAYDLGNENSNCTIPPSREAAIDWLHAMSDSLRNVDAIHPITIGLHAEDLEEDRNLGPFEAAEVCDFLCMHGYPMYLKWAAAADDEHVLPFLGLLTRWLGQGKDVLSEEFGAPAPRVASEEPHGIAMLEPLQSAYYTRRALEQLHLSGHTGAMLWCFADYDESIWSQPPLDTVPHERHFGLWHSDATPKPAVAEVQRFQGAQRLPMADALPWIDISPQEFYNDPPAHLRRLYDSFRARISSGELERLTSDY